jgi:hypothetical protein
MQDLQQVGYLLRWGNLLHLAAPSRRLIFGAGRNENSCGIVSRIYCSLPRKESEVAGTRPGVQNLEKEIVHMTAFLVFFGLVALLIVGGVRGSVRLRPHRLSTGRRVSGLRQSYAAPMNYTTGEETSHYYRKAWVTLILVVLSVIVILIINTLNAAVIH